MSHKKYTLNHIITIIKNEKNIQFDEQKANDIKSDHPSDDIAVLLIDFIRNSLGHACIEYSFKRHGDHDGALLKRIQDFIVEYENYGLDLDQYREERRERDGVDPSMLDIEVEDTTREIVSDVGSRHDIEHSYHTIHRGSKILRRDDLSDDYDDRLHFDDYYEDYEDTAVDYGYLEDSDYEE